MKIGQQVGFKLGIEGHGEIVGKDWMGYCIIVDRSRPAGHRFHRDCRWDPQRQRMVVMVHESAIWPRG